MRRTALHQAAVVMIEDADPAAFGSDVDAVSASVVGQHVGRFADYVMVNDVSVGQVNGYQLGVGLATDEHDLLGQVASLTVRVVAARCGNPFPHFETDGIDHSEVVTALHRDHHPVGGRVVDDVAHLTAQRNG